MSDEKLNQSTQDELYQHLSECASCKMLFEDLSFLNLQIQEEKRLVPKDGLTNRIMVAIESASEPKMIPLWQIALKKSLAVASICLTIWLGYKAGSFYSSKSEPVRSDQQEFAWLDDNAMESIDTWIME